MSIIVYINNKEYSADPAQTILEVCKNNNIDIPHLCYHPDLKAEGRCRLCIVEADGKIVTSCNTNVKNKMQIITASRKLNELRKTTMELLLANAPQSLQEDDNEVTAVAQKLGITTTPFKPKPKKPSDDSSHSIIFDNNKCILCGKCIQKCQMVQKVFAIGYKNRGFHTTISPYLDHDLVDTLCIYCGQCTLVCPASAITEKDDTWKVIEALKDPQKHVVVQTAPSIRASIGETQGMPPGSKVTGKLVTALKMLGFDRIFDTNFGADLTIMEEGTELIDRIKTNKPLPLITSCSPGWILTAENFYPELLENVSTCKSPQQMVGTLTKTYYAEKNGLDPKDIVCVSIMPCTAKKFEAQRPEMRSSGYQDVDIVLTTREAGRMIKQANIDFANLQDSEFDTLMGESTGAAAIFSVTGGVMEASLRLAAELLENKTLEAIDYKQVRGLKGIKEATLTIANMKLNIAIAHGTGNAHQLLTHGPEKYHFIEIMACEGGCIGGGGQPIPTTKEIIKKRTQVIYDIDKNLPFRKSQDNPEVKKLYSDFLEKPGSHRAHDLLHVNYLNRHRT